MVDFNQKSANPFADMSENGNKNSNKAKEQKRSISSSQNNGSDKFKKKPNYAEIRISGNFNKNKESPQKSSKKELSDGSSKHFNNNHRNPFDDEIERNMSGSSNQEKNSKVDLSIPDF